MINKIMDLLKSPDPIEQGIGLSLIESENVNLNHKFWDKLRDIWYILYEECNTITQEQLLALYHKDELIVQQLKLDVIEQLSFLTNLKSLTFATQNKRNPKEILPTSIGKLTNLSKLSISGYGITKLPKEIKNLRNLQEIYLSNNDFEEFPIEICELQKLSTVGLIINYITDIPEDIKKLTNLYMLDVRHNPLKKDKISLIKPLLPKNCNFIHDHYYE